MIRSMVILCLAMNAAVAQDVQRPKIVGLAHISLYAHDYEATRKFYGNFLGFAEPFSLPGKEGGPGMTFFKINDQQFIELSPEREAGSDRLNHYALQVEDAEAMRVYLAAKGVRVPAQVPNGRIGNLNFMIQDPEGHSIEIVQYAADGKTCLTRGQFMPATRVSNHMRHVGFVVTKLDAEMKFYSEVLGFREIWRGSSNGTALSWTNMKLPESDDYVEFMLYKDAPPAARRGSANHLCLLVDSVAESEKELAAKAAETGYMRPLEPKTGINRKRQLNLFDPDGTRTELMEPGTIDGKPAPSSNAPPPQ